MVFVLTILLIILSFILGYQYGEELFNENSYEINTLEDCANLTLINTAQCLNDYVQEIYKYNLTDDEWELSFNELKTRGGDCRDWTNFYKQNMEKAGYSTRINRIFVKDGEEDTKIYHVFLTAYDSLSYCNFDLESVECHKYYEVNLKNRFRFK